MSRPAAIQLRLAARLLKRLAMIDMTDWHFSVGGGLPPLVAAGLAPPATPLHFATVVDLLLHVGAGNPVPRTQIDQRLKAAVAATRLRSIYTRLKNAPHFASYRRRKYDAYKHAALARGAGTATARQLALANGLSAEIAGSRVIVPKGHVVLNGRCDRLPSAAPLYHAFLSTTLNPDVARLSAVRRAAQLGGRKTIYVFTLARDLSALWGHVGSSAEWELLFDADLPVRATAARTTIEFDIIEALLG